jgi:hypothetical protein
MCRKLMNFTKCVGVLILLGLGVGSVVFWKIKEDKKERNVKRKAKKALNAIEDIMNDVQDVFKKS